MTALTFLVLIAGDLLGGRQGLLIAFVFSLAMNLVTFLYGQKIILWTYRASPLSGADPYGLNKMVRELSDKVGLPKPAIYIIPTETPNAFAMGRSPESACIAFTEGVLKLLSKEEIRAVAGHELSHVINRDTLLMMIAATLGSVIMYLASIFKWATILGGRDRDDDRPGSIVGGMMVALLAPLAATLIQLAVSRNREYAADEGSKELTGQPEALASALWKIHNYSESMPLPATLSTAHLFIINPLSTQGVARLFSTHPPVEERIKRLTGKGP